MARRIETPIESARNHANVAGWEAALAWTVAAITVLPNLADGEVLEGAEVLGALVLTGRWLYLKHRYSRLVRNKPQVSI